GRLTSALRRIARGAVERRGRGGRRAGPQHGQRGRGPLAERGAAVWEPGRPVGERAAVTPRKRPAEDKPPRRRATPSRAPAKTSAPGTRETELAKRVRALERDRTRARAERAAESEAHARDVAEGLEQQ